MNRPATHNDPMSFFGLRPIRSATISEISEVTAASPVPEAERVNFHIGNPVQDPRLLEMYCRLTAPDEEIPDSITALLDRFADAGSSDDQAAGRRALIYRAVQNSTNYTPRGGFNRKNPTPLINWFKEWLITGQPEPLSYDFGEESGQRECIIVNGGITETLRVIFHALSRYLVHAPAHILLHGLSLPGQLTEIPGLIFNNFDDSGDDLLRSLQKHFQEFPGQPAYLVLGSQPDETSRRRLRTISLKKPLFFIEANNSKNHLSIAREAQMHDNVIRILFPEVFDKNLGNLATGFLLGNAAYLRVIENIQFELKGTPSAAEMDLLHYLLTHPADNDTPEPDGDLPSISSGETDARDWGALHGLRQVSERQAGFVSTLLQRSEKINTRISGALRLKNLPGQSAVDHFTGLTADEVLDAFFQNYSDPAFHHNLNESLVGVFNGHHPFYAARNCTVVSGSARTALSILGFHCGIREVITYDLSWTYEHCFEKVHVAPLTAGFEIDVAAMMQLIDSKMAADPEWHRSAAIVLNNPHNATGKIFSDDGLGELLRQALSRKITVIDDLSYQSVEPVNRLDGPLTLRQLASQYVRQGTLRSDHLQYLITVHSLSKTDSFAGARLTITEILHDGMRGRFREMLAQVTPNLFSVLISYLFYRNSVEQVRHFWRLRNGIFAERMEALEQAVSDLPQERNPFGIFIRRPQGSMYPQLVVEQLPSGLSLSRLASGLATRGIGLVPLTTFARTSAGFEVARKIFRMTLGGKDDAATLKRKTRRMLIDLNRLIAEETSAYNRSHFKTSPRDARAEFFPQADEKWQRFSRAVTQQAAGIVDRIPVNRNSIAGSSALRGEFLHSYLPERLAILQQRFHDRTGIAADILSAVYGDGKKQIMRILEQEFSKETLPQRERQFRQRLFDRTVHPTQMYSLAADTEANRLIDHFLTTQTIPADSAGRLATAFFEEFQGQNVAISSADEAEELAADLKAHIAAEEYARWNGNVDDPVLLSFWGDWDGSTRPSGQGHRLIASVVIENVNQQARILNILSEIDKSVKVPEELREKLAKLVTTNRKMRELLNRITMLTNQLEKRFRSFLPFKLQTGRLHRIALSLHLAKDPVKALWQHNDRLERKMVHLRQQRRELMEYFFALNKQLRKTLYANLDAIERNLENPRLALPAASFRSLLRRFVLTPRIHQNMITDSDSFAIDTTVHNMGELNEICGKYGNPGMVLAMQVSMSSNPDALISLDRKFRTKREYSLRHHPDSRTPSIWLIPLFEELETTNNIEKYLNKLWSYAISSRRIDQAVNERFAEMVSELFVAGSDISQQISQPAGADAYRRAKHQAVRWCAERGLVDKIRLKLGCGEPMQRQGGYYSDLPEGAPFSDDKSAQKRLAGALKSSTWLSTKYARSPLSGILAHRDLLTVQSNLAEQFKFMPAGDLAQVFYHLRQSQQFHLDQLQRISEPLRDTRLQFHTRGLQDLERLTCGPPDTFYDEFLKLLTANFRQIIYGREEDVVGIHVISYFLSRAIPGLRDRPTVRPNPENRGNIGEQLIERFAQILPLSKHGSLLRAIGHNKAQTMILGLNQLTTGIFRALTEFLNTRNSYGEAISLISERILPRLPVFEILQTLRLYQDPEMSYAKQLERCFPPGNSSFLAMREDLDAMEKFIPLFQRELLKRQGLEIGDFFRNERFKTELLPAVHPVYAVLLQQDIFNTDITRMLNGNADRIDPAWLANLQPLMEVPEKVRGLRADIWKLLEKPVLQQVESFVQLALAVHGMISGQGWNKSSLSVEPAKIMRMSNQVSQSLRTVKDDGLRQFLLSIVQYLTQIPSAMTELPIDIIHALQDVERIARIEEQVLTGQQQQKFRFYLLQMARLCGENG
jgi:aspartate/methionine/tyrosine aminotransferase